MGAIVVFIVVGVNFAFWGLVGAARAIDESFFERRRKRKWRPRAAPDPLEIAAILPAHNESLVIEKTLVALARLLPVQNIHVVSDGSIDDTAEIARAFGARVLELSPGRGKAGALSEAIRHFELIQRFRAVLILDADSRLDKEYLQRALHCFSDREVVAVAGFATTEWPGREESLWARFLIAYRERVYVLTQYLQKYGQTWKRTNVAYIVPGYASMYRSRALERIDIAAPGLIIEDFNMTFELQHKGLGRVAFHPNIVGYTQDPNTFRDYVRQVKRWQLGFWQTIRRHRFWPSTFCAALVLNIVELIVASVFLLVLPIGLALAALHQTVGVPGALDSAGATAANIFEPTRVLLLVFLPDYLMSCAVAIVRRRPSYLLFGLAFLPMRLVDAAIVMWAVPAAFFTKSTGSWVSPTRR